MHLWLLILPAHMKIPEVIDLTEVNVHSLIMELLLSWEDTCKNSTVIVKMMDTKNIIQDYLLMSLYPHEVKYTLLVCKDTEKIKLYRKAREPFRFSPCLCQIGGNVRVYKAFINWASENSTVNVKLMKIRKITWISPYVSTTTSFNVTLSVSIQ
jgi:hypothetical protein